MLGRHRHRHQELNSRHNVDSQPLTLHQTTAMSDIAIASFGTARISCWTRPEDRKWGIHHQQNAAVMRFRMKAAGPDDCKLSDFELDLEFSVLPGDQGIMDAECTTQGGSATVIADNQAEVCLIELPAPSCVPVPPTIDCWSFRSDSIADEQNGRSRTARWIWETSGEHRMLEGRILHGGIALRHPGKPFLVTCHVKGKVSKPGGFKLKFSSRHHVPRLWQIVPMCCEEDLQCHINRLEEEMVRLNTTGIMRNCFLFPSYTIRADAKYRSDAACFI